jgi:hypothetical protein
MSVLNCTPVAARPGTGMPKAACALTKPPRQKALVRLERSPLRRCLSGSSTLREQEDWRLRVYGSVVVGRP